ncbi:MAG: hypothetical protein CM1200mP41_25330 [Gammaproteobacteria bacterium]|nr:MAG: hypothetical protein CM1200mP41_25330 [Gammaproteobacteria bacterium]
MEWNRLSDDQKNDFLSGRSEESSDQARLKFLLGDRSKEGSEFHTRSSVLGPIARSAPVYVGAPNQTWLTSVGGSAYANFLKKAAKRKAVVYVGSNGGALHGFDAVTGEEELAYYPGPFIDQAMGVITILRWQVLSTRPSMSMGSRV